MIMNIYTETAKYQFGCKLVRSGILNFGMMGHAEHRQVRRDDALRAGAYVKMALSVIELLFAVGQLFTTNDSFVVHKQLVKHS